MNVKNSFFNVYILFIIKNIILFYNTYIHVYKIYQNNNNKMKLCGSINIR